MRNFDQFLEEQKVNSLCYEIGELIESNDIPLDLTLEYWFESLIASEVEFDRRQQLNEIMGWLGDKIGQGVQNFKQGYGQGVATSQGKNDPFAILNHAYQMLIQAGFDQQVVGNSLQGVAQWASQQQGQGQQGQQGQQGSTSQFQPQQGQKFQMGEMNPEVIKQQQQGQKFQMGEMNPEALKRKQQQQQMATVSQGYFPQNSHYSPEGEPFYEFLDTLNLETQIEETAYLLATLIDDPEGYVFEFAVNELGENFGDLLLEAQPFANHRGRFSNWMHGLKGLGQGAFGGGAAGISGGVAAPAGAMMGGGLTGGLSALKGATFGGQGGFKGFGTGASAGFQPGANVAKGMWDVAKGGFGKMKDAFGNRHQAYFVSAYRKAIKALDTFSKSIDAAVPDAEKNNAWTTIGKLKNELEKLGTRIEKGMAPVQQAPPAP